MRLKIIFPILLLFFVVKMFAQSDFRDGYIITNENDTVHGLIDYRGNKSNAEKCSFKHGINSEILEYGTSDLKGYRFIDSKYYVSKSIKNGDTESLKFLEYLIDGIVDIYYYRDENGEHYLIDTGDRKLIELTNNEETYYVKDVKYKSKSNKYLGVLNYAFFKSPSICQELKDITLEHKSLIGIAEKYHNQVCTGEKCIIYEKKLPKIKLIVGPLIGINAITISTNNNFGKDFYYMQNSDFNIYTYPSVGFFLKVNMPYIDERVYFQYEGTICQWTLKTTNLFIDSVLYYYANYISEITMTNIVFDNEASVRYEFPKGKIRPVFQAGFFLNYFLKSDYLRNTGVRYKNGNIFFTETSKDYPFSKFDYGVSVGLGILSKINDKREIALDIRYKQGLGMRHNVFTNNLSLNLCIQIGK
jgi:hypothetical protein